MFTIVLTSMLLFPAALNNSIVVVVVADHVVLKFLSQNILLRVVELFWFPLSYSGVFITVEVHIFVRVSHYMASIFRSVPVFTVFSIQVFFSQFVCLFGKSSKILRYEILQLFRYSFGQWPRFCNMQKFWKNITSK